MTTAETIAKLQTDLDSLTAEYRTGTVAFDKYLASGSVLKANLDALQAAHDKATQRLEGNN